MPQYTYRCGAGHEWVEFRRIEGSEVSEEVCPECPQAEGEVPRGRKVPSGSVAVNCNLTPIFYPNRRTK